MATFIKRGDSWQAKIRRRGFPTITRTFDTKAAAERWARDAESEMSRNVYVDGREAEQTTLFEALERYEREVTPKKKGAARERYLIARWKKDDLALRSLASIRGADLASWRDKRLAEGASPSTVRNNINLISHLFNIASREWGLESLNNPVRKITLPSPGRGRDRRLMDDEEARLMTALEGLESPWMKPLAQLALETGMRQGEMLGLRWEHVSLGRRVARLQDTKNGEARDVPLSTKAVKVLEALPRELKGRVFPITRDQASYFFAKAAKAAGIEDLRFHDLRHEATSRFFERGLNMMEAAAITGHKTLQMLKRYTHLKAEDLAKRLG
ncbi:Phage integrase family protein [Rhodospirillaceae bacterium LM-1]|nr:Phage integrase family protein [Rhodospirillaceae bacterium LM-1]